MAVQASQAAELPRITLLIGHHQVVAEVAADDTSRSQGLMHRTALQPDHGMLFVFSNPEPKCFWMKNTPLPLTIAFIDSHGTITSTADMQANSLQPHCSIAPVQYALEMEQGWFARHGVGAGTRLEGLPGPSLR